MVGCRCLSSEKKYGAPVVCEQCKLKCAFERPQNQKEKVCVCGGSGVCAVCAVDCNFTSVGVYTHCVGMFV